MVDRGATRELAGLFSWIGSIVPAVKPYIGMLWTAAPAAGASSLKCARARMSLPVRWFHAFAEEHLIRPPRGFPAVKPTNPRNSIVIRGFSFRYWGDHQLPNGRETRYLATLWDGSGYADLVCEGSHGSMWCAYCSWRHTENSTRY